MHKLFSLAFFVAVVSGCANFNSQPIDAKAVASLKNKTVTHTARTMPDFAAMTPARAAFGMFGAAVTISEGNKIIRENKVPDPADAIAIGLAKTLEEKYGSSLINPPIAVSTDEVAQVASAVGGKAKFVIDVQTFGWVAVYFPTDWSHYRLIYSAKARLIDADAKTVVAEGSCKWIPEANSNSPTYDELLANEASRLKAELSIISDECIKSLRAEMFSSNS